MNTQPELIAGIYNFCDAWCERCLFTRRCRSFQLQQEASLANSQNPGDKLIQQLTEALNLTKQYVENLSRKQDFSGTERPTEDQAQQLEYNAKWTLAKRREESVGANRAAADTRSRIRLTHSGKRYAAASSVKRCLGYDSVVSDANSS